MAVTMIRTPWIDDDGTGTTGTILNNAVKQELYDQIDAALAKLPPATNGLMSGDLKFSPDATYDIGKAGANRPRDGFFANNLMAGGVLNVNDIAPVDFASALRFSSGGLVRGQITATGRFVWDGPVTLGLNGYFVPPSLNTPGFRFNNAADDANLITFANSGAVRFHVYGSGTITSDANGQLTSVSDARYKDRIAPLAYGLATVLQLNPVEHGYNAESHLDRDHLYAGFLAHEVQAVLPLAVGQDRRGYLTLADRPILGALVNAIKELDGRLVHLEGRS